MMSKTLMLATIGFLALLAQVYPSIAQADHATPLAPIEQLGKDIFFDTNLSEPKGQACAACHAPNVGWTGPDQSINLTGAVYEGAVPGRFGNRKPPSSAYGGDSPVLNICTDTGVFKGGMFWDGRATGLTLGDPLAEQAEGPFLNPLEQNNPNEATVVHKVLHSSYAWLFKQVWKSAFNPQDIHGTYVQIARSIAAYERSHEVSAFTSKYDYYLKGWVKLTKQEKDGLKLFEDKAKCAQCHPSRADNKKPLFTDFTYDNLGVPKNPMNPFYTMPKQFNPLGFNWIDYGLGGFLKNIQCAESTYQAELGKMKVPTLRNVDKRPYPDFVKAYSHNGYFKSLKATVHFYNTRDIPGLWPPPEVSVNVNKTEVGNLGLTPEEEDAIVAFLKTLSDGYDPH